MGKIADHGRDECVTIMVGIDDDDEHSVYLYTPGYRTEEGEVPEYETEAILEIAPDMVGPLDLSVERYEVHPLSDSDDRGQASRHAEAVHARVRHLEQQDESRFHEFLEGIRVALLESNRDIFKRFPE